ncbi:MAG: InlB B-repeat-containing protein [Clostridiales bacterium]|nr:InlB B-repeat-containing protein [Clostridiales bacterium]
MSSEERDGKKPYERQMRGLYDRVNLSVGTLNRIIIVLSILLVAVIAFAISKSGYTVTFDSQGGTAVESQERMYGDLLDAPEDPTRQGFVFTGWYRDPDCTVVWDMEGEEVAESLTLYAGWAEEPSDVGNDSVLP